ncbi:MAG: AsnC family transcriptional regulator [Dehalococcoidia bacterium]
MHFDDVDKRLLNAIQIAFPLSREPFSVLGQRLGIGADEVLRRIERFKREGAVRQIGPVLEAVRLGYRTTLVAMRVAQNRLAQAAQAIGQHPGISHGYERDHYFNLWFTLALPPGAEVQTELQELSTIMAPEVVLELPALRLFKIGVYFDLAGDGRQMLDSGIASPSTLHQKADLSLTDKLVIDELQGDMPLVPRPFDIGSTRLLMDVDEFLAHCRSLQQRGIMRRFGASIDHNNIGFRASAMACWVAPPEVVEIAGRKVAALREVSHCYERKTGPLWPYNLFAMIHGHAREDCQMIADKVSRETGLDEYVLLFSVKELKKTRVKYLL